MTRDDIVQHWVNSSDGDFPVMESLFANGHYAWSLFVGHLVLEKLLKALYYKNAGIDAPFIHNLTKLAQKAGLALSAEQEDFLDDITSYNINARYEDVKSRFHKRATREFTERKIAEIKEYRQWLKSLMSG